MDGRLAHPAGRISQRRHRRNPFRPVHLAEQLCAGAGHRQAAAARRRDHRHQPGPRGQQRCVAPPRRRRHPVEGMAGRSRQRHARPRGAGQPAQRAHAPAGLLPVLQHRRPHQPGGADHRQGPRGRRHQRGRQRGLCAARPARCRCPRRRRAAVLAVQDLRPAPRRHGAAPAAAAAPGQRGALLQRRLQPQAPGARRAGPCAGRRRARRGRVLRRARRASRRR